MSHGELQGWFADPFRLHEQRYFSAGQPTKLVRDGPIEGYDEPPAAAEASRAAASAAAFWPGDAIDGPASSGRRRRGQGFSTWYTITDVIALKTFLQVAGNASGFSARPVDRQPQLTALSAGALDSQRSHARLGGEHNGEISGDCLVHD